MRETFDLFNRFGRSNLWRHRYSRYWMKYVAGDTWLGLKCFVRGHHRDGDFQYCCRCHKFIGKKQVSAV